MENRLKQIRTARGLTQQEMATALSEKVATYRTWERGTTNFNIVQLVECARILDCSTDEILGLEIKTNFADPREAELHAIWHSLTPISKDHLLHQAKAELALLRRDDQESADAETGDRRSA